MLESLLSQSKVKPSPIGVNMKIGNWKYKKSNNTLNFKTKTWREAPDGTKIGPYSYEVDLDRGSICSWFAHLAESKGSVMTRQDLYDFLCFDSSLSKEMINSIMNEMLLDKKMRKEFFDEILTKKVIRQTNDSQIITFEFREDI
jgi:hypothetical protein